VATRQVIRGDSSWRRFTNGLGIDCI